MKKGVNFAWPQPTVRPPPVFLPYWSSSGAPIAHVLSPLSSLRSSLSLPQKLLYTNSSSLYTRICGIWSRARPKTIPTPWTYNLLYNDEQEWDRVEAQSFSISNTPSLLFSSFYSSFLFYTNFSTHSIPPTFHRERMRKRKREKREKRSSRKEYTTCMCKTLTFNKIAQPNGKLHQC